VTDVLVTLGLVVTIVVVEWGLFIRKFGSPQSRMRSTVIKHIQAPGTLYKVKVGNIAGTWNPAHVRLTMYDTGLIYGKGQGTYWRDEDGVVHLLFRPVIGPDQHLAALVPAPASRAGRSWAALGIIAAYPVMALVGFAVGYAAASGSGQSPSTVGLLGAVLGFLSVYLVFHGLLVGRAVVANKRRGVAVETPPTSRAPDARTATPVPAGPVPQWVTTELQRDKDRGALRTTWQVPRAWPVALLGVLGILIATFVLDPLSNSDRVSTAIGDLLAMGANVFGLGGILLLLVSLAFFIVRVSK
jgi:hypothetical protein